MNEKIEIVDVTPENVDEMPCCGVKDPCHEGRQRKVAWLKAHFDKGLRARILLFEGKQQFGYIESLPGQYVWRRVEADGYMFIHCLWVFYRKFQNKGYGRRLIQSVADDAAAKKMKGVAVITRKRPWASGSEIFLKNGFETVDSLPPDYELLAKKLDPKTPDPSFRRDDGLCFQEYGEGLTLIRAGQCPHTIRFSEKICESARETYHMEPRVIDLDTCQDAQNAPTPYAVFSIILEGQLLVDHQISRSRFQNIMNKRLGHKPSPRSTKP